MIGNINYVNSGTPIHSENVISIFTRIFSRIDKEELITYCPFWLFWKEYDKILGYKVEKTSGIFNLLQSTKSLPSTGILDYKEQSVIASEICSVIDYDILSKKLLFAGQIIPPAYSIIPWFLFKQIGNLDTIISTVPSTVPNVNTDRQGDVDSNFSLCECNWEGNGRGINCHKIETLLQKLLLLQHKAFDILNANLIEGFINLEQPNRLPRRVDFSEVGIGISILSALKNRNLLVPYQDSFLDVKKLKLINPVVVHAYWGDISGDANYIFTIMMSGYMAEY